MKVSHDKFSKAGTLQLHLQKYEGKYGKEEKDISGEEIRVPSLRFEKESEGQRERRSNSKISTKQQGLVQQEGQNTVSNVQDEQQLLAMCISLTSRVEGLKKQKYQHVVQQYQEEQRRKIEETLAKQQKILAHKYAASRKELTSSYEQEKMKLNRACEQIGKFKDAYRSILEQLVERKAKMNKQYEQCVLKVKQQKDRLVGEWKRSSNEEIIKAGLKST